MRQDNTTKQKLLETAMELIWVSSYGSVGVDDICKRAGVSKGSFYHFFPSKSDLAVQALDERWRMMQLDLDRIFSSQKPPLERIYAYCDYIHERQKQMHSRTGKVCGCPFASVGSEMSLQDEKVRQKSQDYFDGGVRYLEGALRDAAHEKRMALGDLHEQARQIYSYIMGVLFQARIENKLESLKYLKSGVTQLLNLKKGVTV